MCQTATCIPKLKCTTLVFCFFTIEKKFSLLSSVQTGLFIWYFQMLVWTFSVFLCPHVTLEQTNCCIPSSVTNEQVFYQQVYTINFLQPLFLQCPGTIDSLLLLLHSMYRVALYNSITPYSKIILTVLLCRLCMQQKGTVVSVSHISQTEVVR